MKTKHILILLLSVCFISIPGILQSRNIHNEDMIIRSEKIYQNNKEMVIFEAPDYLIKEKSSYNKRYILLDSKKIPVYMYPSSNSALTDYIQDAQYVSILESTEEWYKILYNNEKSGYILKRHTTENKSEAEKAAHAFKQNKSTPEHLSSNVFETTPNKGQEVVECAKKYLGVKYVYGGSSPSGFDCSGLVQYVCKSVGISVNRTAASQFNNGKAVNKNELLPGDLLFFAKNGKIHHVGIYAGDGKMIHAPQTGDVVKLSDFNTPYRQREFVGARRVV